MADHNLAPWLGQYRCAQINDYLGLSLTRLREAAQSLAGARCPSLWAFTLSVPQDGGAVPEGLL